jgi:hypothetical protein
MSFYVCFDWFKKLRLFSYVLNLKIDIVLNVSRAVVIRRFSLNEAPLAVFKFISDYLPYLQKETVTVYYKRWCHRWCHWKRLERCLFQLFSDNLAVVLDFMILQDKHNMHTLLLKFLSVTLHESGTRNCFIMSMTK